MRDPYCRTLPGQLKAWDATSLRCLMECPRKYQLQQNEGWRERGTIHLEFGSLYHSGCEMFDKLLLDGMDKAAATSLVFHRFVHETVGALETSYLPTWRCTAPATKIATRGARKGEAIKDAKRCRRAKEPQFDGGHKEGAPCPDCGLPTEDDWTMISVNPYKNRDTLLRTILHYCDTSDERVLPFAFPDGTKAVELTFGPIALPLISPDGDPYLLCGNFDGLVSFAGETLPRERKTTKNSVGSFLFKKYEPDVQIDTYDLVAWLLYSDLLDPKPHGVMVEVTQVTAKETKIDRQIINIPEERREEWLRDLQFWIALGEQCAKDNYWPKNTSACHVNGGCPFRDICKLAPSSRKAFLPGEKFEKREKRWNPLDVR